MSEEKIPFDWELYSKNPSQWKVKHRNGQTSDEEVTLRTDCGLSEEELMTSTYPLVCGEHGYTLSGKFYSGKSESSADLFMTKIAKSKKSKPAPEPVKELPDLGYVNVYYRNKGRKTLAIGNVFETLEEAMKTASNKNSKHLTTIRLQDIPEVREILKTINLD